MKYIYTGSSWAKSSFPLDKNPTNLAKLWNIPFIDCSEMNASVLANIDTINRVKTNLPVIWIYNDPVRDIEKITGIDNIQLLTEKNWESYKDRCNQYCLEQISKLGRPVLLIGGASDVKDCNFPNIRVSYNSWQKFIAEKAGLSVVDGVVRGTYDSGTKFQVKDCWTPENIHKTMFENPNINPVSGLVDNIWNTFFFWKELERLGWFADVHPNRKSTEAFAEFLLPDVIKFLEDTK